MDDYLLFRLYGPLAAWGSIAVGQERPSDTQPSKSAILGLLAAALGVRRHEETALAALADGYGYAVRVDAPGILLRDFHTAEVPSRVSLKKRPHFTRRDEVMAVGLNDNPVLSTREYRCDALYTVVLWRRSGSDAPYALADLKEALERPRLVLYLGRKSCPLALPVAARLESAADLGEAFDKAVFPEDGFTADENRDWLDRSAVPDVFWDEDASPGDLKPLLTLTRRDRPLNRRRWQFGERRERRGHANVKPQS